jgi:hypothetical protein
MTASDNILGSGQVEPKLQSMVIAALRCDCSRAPAKPEDQLCGFDQPGGR